MKQSACTRLAGEEFLAFIVTETAQTKLHRTNKD